VRPSVPEACDLIDWIDVIRISEERSKFMLDIISLVDYRKLLAISKVLFPLELVDGYSLSFISP